MGGRGPWAPVLNPVSINLDTRTVGPVGPGICFTLVKLTSSIKSIALTKLAESDIHFEVN